MTTGAVTEGESWEEIAEHLPTILAVEVFEPVA